MLYSAQLSYFHANQELVAAIEVFENVEQLASQDGVDYGCIKGNRSLNAQDGFHKET